MCVGQPTQVFARGLGDFKLAKKAAELISCLSLLPIAQMAVALGKMVERGFAANGRAGFSPREALASLPDSGAEAPRGLKSALQNHRGEQRFVWLVVQALACALKGQITSGGRTHSNN